VYIFNSKIVLQYKYFIVADIDIRFWSTCMRNAFEASRERESHTMTTADAYSGLVVVVTGNSVIDPLYYSYLDLHLANHHLHAEH
jgi:hypothetical protein